MIDNLFIVIMKETLQKDYKIDPIISKTLKVSKNNNIANPLGYDYIIKFGRYNIIINSTELGPARQADFLKEFNIKLCAKYPELVL